MRGTDGAIWHVWPDPYYNVLHWESLGGSGSGEPSLTVSAAGVISVYFRGGDNALWVTAGNTSHWNSTRLGGVLASAPMAINTGYGVRVFMEGADGQLWQDSGGGAGWDAPTGMPWVWQGEGGRVLGRPAAVSTGGGDVDVFVEGADQALWRWSTNGSWSGLKGRLAGQPAAVGSGTSDVFVEGTDNSLWHWSSYTSKWEALGGRLGAPPAAVGSTNGFMAAFVRGPDGSVWRDWFDGSWHWEGIGGSIIGTPSVVATSSVRIDVYARGTDAALWSSGYR
jgi:hypothetical protein